MSQHIKTWQERAGVPLDCKPLKYAHGWYWDEAIAEIADLRAALEDARRPDSGKVAEGWRPMSTAPKDGTRFLGKLDGKVDFWHWQALGMPGAPIGWRNSFILVYPEGSGPTGWMPIPAADSAATEQAGTVQAFVVTEGQINAALAEAESQPAERAAEPVNSVALNLEAQLRAAIAERDALRAAAPATQGAAEPVAIRHKKANDDCAVWSYSDLPNKYAAGLATQSDVIVEHLYAAAPVSADVRVPTDVEQRHAESELYLSLTQDAMKMGYDGIPAALEALQRGASADVGDLPQTFDQWFGKEYGRPDVMSKGEYKSMQIGFAAGQASSAALPKALPLPEVVHPVIKALRDDAAGNSKATMTDIDLAVGWLETYVLKGPQP
jgi:hypothetical protein